ncbi:DUF4133 domain-containing protein [Niabella sp. 22666]|uniref:DUF4133 domain-containing protein n=1 Tax=Niabella sp. 22666 TaxID=3453954 RepID=UPI003F84D7BA
MASVYKINKGVNQPVVFKGLKAQYIWWLGGGLVTLLLLFAILYIIGVNMYVCLLIILVLGTLLFKKVYSMSRKYGEYGLMKKIAKRRIPKVIKTRSRTVYMKRSYK